MSLVVEIRRAAKSSVREQCLVCISNQLLEEARSGLSDFNQIRMPPMDSKSPRLSRRLQWVQTSIDSELNPLGRAMH